ncbi:lipopolysaccharide export system ATP-binding protein [Klebsormidium nitens]|uniref:Lipopolysaccharide export system ATP-binding protein n=1 Tax=Klebsormidium nitens TaxID=105231 RepID=A0A1Y1IFB9_KLENI|nr:lipopolysaccharide export system ATP-binding protein [Klebsormidium nitens]|eukprot:GAQ88722.1 lipopolysaccharide export system ATP-binding protein [Klebsormidium nitens]
MMDEPKTQPNEEPTPSLVARFFRLFSRKQQAGSPSQESSLKSELRAGPFEIHLRDVSRVYGKRAVVDGVNLNVKQGEVVGLLGPNGAGKSTTFNITVGRERPSQGCVLLNGRDITALPLAARARLGVGYLTQEPSVFRGLSVRDNLLLILQETGVPRAEHAGRTEELLAEFRLTHVQHTKGAALSGGERRRTELARALASNCSGGPPRILLVDEPFAGVDPIGVAEIQALLRKLCDELHMGILITDHNVTETLKICDRAYMVFQGQVMAQGSPEELVRNPFVRQYYLGEGYKRPESQMSDESFIGLKQPPTS